MAFSRTAFQLTRQAPASSTLSAYTLRPQLRSKGAILDRFPLKGVISESPSRLPNRLPSFYNGCRADSKRLLSEKPIANRSISCQTSTISNGQTPRHRQLSHHDPLSGLQRPSQSNFTRQLSSGITRGTDLLADSLTHGPHRKIILESYGPSGFDIKHLIQVGSTPDPLDPTDENSFPGEDRILHMNGSILAFPTFSFLWNVKTPKDVTLESLSVVKLFRPTVEYLFIGCDSPLPPRELNRIKKEFRKRDVVVEQMDIMNAMGTFNILNGEDRRVAVGLVLNES